MLLRLKQDVINAELRARREGLGLTQEQLAAAIGENKVHVIAIERLHPLGPAGQNALIKLASFFGVDADLLYPRWMQEAIKEGLETSVSVDKDVSMVQLTAREVRALPAPNPTIQADTAEHVRQLMQHIKDPMDREIVEMLYGLNGKPKMALWEVGKIVGRTKEAVRQRSSHALRDMREAERKQA